MKSIKSKEDQVSKNPPLQRKKEVSHFQPFEYYNKNNIQLKRQEQVENSAPVSNLKAIQLMADKSIQKKSSNTLDRTIQLKAVSEQITLFNSGMASQVTFDDEKKLSSGANGDVFIGSLNGEKVIVKRAKGEGVSEMKNEIGIFESLTRHKKVIRGIGYSTDKKILVIQKADTSLNKKLPRTTKDRVRLISDIGDGLSHLHKQHVTHGDLNLKNILSVGPYARLTDFGGSVSFGGKDEIQKPVPAGMEAFIQQDHPSLKIRKDENIKADLKDFMKAAANILRGHTEDKVLHDREVERLKIKLKNENLFEYASLINLIEKDNPTVSDFNRFQKIIKMNLFLLSITPRKVGGRRVNNIRRKKK